MHYLICYDIQDDKIRRRVHQALIDLGEPVQYSAVVLETNKRVVHKLITLLTPMIETGDSIRSYPLCKKCRDSTTHLGTARPDTITPDFFWSD